MSMKELLEIILACGFLVSSSALIDYYFGTQK